MYGNIATWQCHKGHVLTISDHDLVYRDVNVASGAMRGIRSDHPAAAFSSWFPTCAAQQVLSMLCRCGSIDAGYSDSTGY